MLYGNIKIPIKILRDSYYHIKNYLMENIFLFNLILLGKLNIYKSLFVVDGC